MQEEKRGKRGGAKKRVGPRRKGKRQKGDDSDAASGGRRSPQSLPFAMGRKGREKRRRCSLGTRLAGSRGRRGKKEVSYPLCRTFVISLSGNGRKRNPFARAEKKFVSPLSREKTFLDSRQPEKRKACSRLDPKKAPHRGSPFMREKRPSPSSPLTNTPASDKKGNNSRGGNL